MTVIISGRLISPGGVMTDAVIHFRRAETSIVSEGNGFDVRCLPPYVINCMSVFILADARLYYGIQYLIWS